MARLDGKVTIITGAASGLGRVAALKFAAEGSRVVVADITDGTDTVSAVAQTGGTAAYIKLDVTSEESWKETVAFTLSTFGSVDVLYNNAGVMIGDDDNPVTTSVDTYQRTMDINVKGVLLGCKYAIPTMLEQGKGSIINVASFVAHMGAATPQVAYTASKGAVLAMTREIAVIYARKGIRANALCPGPVMTPLLAAFLDNDEKRNRRLVHIPMGRFGQPEEIANGALFLASDESSWMTGQSLIIDGGITAAYVTPE
ncbi:MAG: glucose 1-dehydrogenase [Ilumatobacteraceae bacterium]|nr:glucose 1-dehydrogenase [Ilumatobacteraceae bacterium]MBJ7368072.1 glucose 1-dehydrogenase [Ilumatobacteraceae bacterium]MCX6515299.1 glucose 1-dehydrogenase [Actinomycetota bacterium]